MKVALCMAGTTTGKQAFWRCWENLGLAPATDLVLQVNSPIGRSRDNVGNFPEDWAGQDLSPVVEAVSRRTESLLARWTPKPYSFGFVDYEPRRYAADGKTITERWMLNILRNGLADHDTRFLEALLDGMKEAAPQLPLSLYTVPRLPKADLTDEDRQRAMTARPIVHEMGWTWMNAYATGDSDRDWLDLQNINDHIRRLHSAYEMHQKFARPVIPFLWPSYRMTAEESRQYNAPTIGILHRLNAETQGQMTHIGIWVDCTYDTVAMKEAENAAAFTDTLRAAVGA